MRLFGSVVLTCIMWIVSGCTTTLKMGAPSPWKANQSAPQPRAVGLLISKELSEYVHKKKGVQGLWSNHETIEFPIGEYTAASFRTNLPLVFEKVVDADARLPASGVDLVIQPSIVQVDTALPSDDDPWVRKMPGFMAEYRTTLIAVRVEYQVDVFDKRGEKVCVRGAVGFGHDTARTWDRVVVNSLFAKAAQTAMDDAMAQIMGGLASAEELMGQRVTQ